MIDSRRGCSSMVEQQPSKLMTRVRFPSPAPTISIGYSSSLLHSDNGAFAHSDKTPSFVRPTSRFLVPAATCRMVRLTYFPSTLGDLCRPWAISSRSVNSESPASVNPPCRKDVKVSSSRSPAVRITSLTLRLICVRSTSSSFGQVGHGACWPQSRRSIRPAMRNHTLESNAGHVGAFRKDVIRISG
jgi:hypothetical protein